MHNNLKQIRKIKGITQKDLADNLQVSKAMVSMWENNPTQKIPPSRVKQIAQFLKVREEELFSEVLNSEAIERMVIQDTVDDLVEKHANNIERENVQRIKALEQHHSVISNELKAMLNEPEKLDRVSRLSQILNNQEIETVFEKNIRPFALYTIQDRFLSLLEDKNPSKLSFLFMVIEYLQLLNDNNTLDEMKAAFSDYEEFFLEFDKLFKLILESNGGNR